MPRRVWGSGRIGPMFSLLSLRAGEWSASCAGCFTSGERYHGVHRIGGWVGRCEETKFQQLVVRLYTDWAILTPLLSSEHWFELIVNISVDRGNFFHTLFKVGHSTTSAHRRQLRWRELIYYNICIFLQKITQHHCRHFKRATPISYN